MPAGRRPRLRRSQRRPREGHGELPRPVHEREAADRGALQLRRRGAAGTTRQRRGVRGSLPRERDGRSRRRARAPRRRRSATSATASSGSASGCRGARTRSTPRSASSRSDLGGRGRPRPEKRHVPGSSPSSGACRRPKRRRGRPGSGSRTSAPAGARCTRRTRSCSTKRPVRSGWPIRSRAFRRGSACTRTVARGTRTAPGTPSASAPRWAPTGGSRRRARTATSRSRSRCATAHPDDETLLFHCLVPAARWWEDIVFT